MSTQLRVFEDDEIFFKAPFDLAEWQARGKEFRPSEDATRDQVESRQWAIGDWLIEGETRGKLKERALKKHALELHLTGYKNWGSLKNLKSWVKRFPPARRRDGKEGRPFLEFSVHVEVLKFDEPTQEALLTKATTLGVKPGGKGWKIAELRKYIRDEQKDGRLPLTGKKPKADELSYIKIAIDAGDVKMFEDIAWKMFKVTDPGRFGRWILREFWREHGEEIKSRLADGTLPLISRGLYKNQLP